MKMMVAKGSDGIGSVQEVSIWAQVCERLRSDLGEKKFQFWFANLQLLCATSEKVDIGCPTVFIRDYVNQNFSAFIARALHDVAPELGPLQFSFAPRPVLAVSNAAPPALETDASHVDPTVLERLAPGSILPNANCTFRDFVVGKSNQVAHAAAVRAAELVASGAKPVFNPLFLYSGSGLGKTHLMNAIVWHVLQNNSKAKILYITAESFMRRFVTAMKERDMLAFKEEMQSVDVLLVDDIQFIADKNATQEEFFYRFNELVDKGKQVILSADRSPAQLDGVADRVRARMLHGVTLEIHSTDIELRLAIIDRKLERHRLQHPNVIVPDEVRHFLAGRVATNTRELEGAIHKLVYVADTMNEAVTLDFARRALADVLNYYDRKLTVDEIKRTTAGFFGLRVSDLDSPRRTRNLVRPRQTAMFLAKSLTSRSYPEIGRRFGGRDHTTVMHAVRQVERLCSSDPVFAEEVETLRKILKDGAPMPAGRRGPDTSNGGGERGGGVPAQLSSTAE